MRHFMFVYGHFYSSFKEPGVSVKQNQNTNPEVPVYYKIGDGQIETQNQHRLYRLKISDIKGSKNLDRGLTRTIE